MPTLTHTFICTGDGQPRSYQAHTRDLGHHAHQLTTDPRARSGRREACRRTTPTTDQGLGALCHARLRPAWLRCGPKSFPEALGSHRGAEIIAVITPG